MTAPRTCKGCEYFTETPDVLSANYSDFDGRCTAVPPHVHFYVKKADAACDCYAPIANPKERLWLNDFRYRNSRPLLMEEKNGVRLYKTQSWYIGPGQHEHGTAPVYHVWAGDEWLATEHYLDAYNAWKSRAEGAGKDG